jgi:hypothetical protein
MICPRVKCTKDKELNFLISCAREDLGLGDEEEVKKAAAIDMDWGRVADLAEAHGILPILYRASSQVVPEFMPEPLMISLRLKYLQNSQKNYLLSTELISILNFLESKEICVLPFKGPFLAEFLYGSSSLRYFSDLDLLVLRDDVFKTKIILESLGYRQDRLLSREQEAAFLKSKHHYHLIHPIKRVQVDLHWRIAPIIYSFDLDCRDLIERSVSKIFYGKKVQTISDEDMLLILCEHGIRHYWKRLIWICDIAIMLKLGAINWPQTIKRAFDIGCARALFLGIFLAIDLLGAPLPSNSNIAEQIQMDKEILSLAEKIYNELISDGPAQRVADIDELKVDVDEELLYLRARERKRDKARYYMRRITIPTEDDWDSISLPGFLFPVYHFVRPIRLIGRYKFSIGKWIRSTFWD